MRLPIDIRDISHAGERAREERERPVRIAILIEPDAPEALVYAAREHIRPATSAAKLQIEVVMPDSRVVLGDDLDAMVALIGSGSDSIRQALASSRDAYVPTAALGLSDDQDALARRLSHPVFDTLADVDPERLVTRHLGEWLADRLSGKRLALAHNFAFMRRSTAEESVKATAFQNAVIGVVAFIPGADLPIMTANQAKMLLQIAAAYGEPLGTERAKELAAVVGGAFALRAVARQLLGFVPGVGWAIKGGIAYAGTMAMGAAAISYFEHGADFSEVIHEATAARDRAMADARARLHRDEKRALAPAAVASPAVPAAVPTTEGDSDQLGVVDGSDI